MLGAPNAIDATMERASASLVKADYFGCERLCLRALQAAWRALDFERLGRICLPLQESRRLIRQQALDAALGGARFVLSSAKEFPAKAAPGFYLVQPPLIGADARRIRELLNARAIPALVLCREPMTLSRRWPLVAVGEMSYRVQVEPPAGVSWTGQGLNRDTAQGPPSAEWFLASSEALGDATFAKVDRALPAAWRVEDILKALDAFPDHEKLHQHLGDACRAALHEPLPTVPRPRRDDAPHSF